MIEPKSRLHLYKCLLALQEEHRKKMTSGEGFGLTSPEMAAYLDEKLGYSQVCESLQAIVDLWGIGIASPNKWFTFAQSMEGLTEKSRAALEKTRRTL
jgi:hypothetical protein